MTKKDNTSPKKQARPRVHKELDGFEVSIDQFGELKSNMKIEKLNDFLNENVDDKKLTDRGEFEEKKKSVRKKK